MLVTFSELKTLIGEAHLYGGLDDIKPGDSLQAGDKQYFVVKVYEGSEFVTRHAVAFNDEEDVEIWPSWKFEGTRYVRTPIKAGDSFQTTGMNGADGMYYGWFRCSQLTLRVNINPMSAFGGLPVTKKDITFLHVVSFIDGEEDMFDEWLAQENAGKYAAHNGFYVDLARVKFVKGRQPESMGDLSGFRKPDIIAYVVSSNGPLTRMQVLRQVATIQGAPYIPTSNTQYFNNLQKLGLQRVVQDGKKVYVTTPDGERMAQRVRDRIGDQPAIDVREDE